MLSTFSEEVCDVKVWAGQYSHFKLQKSDEETRVIFLNRENFEKITKNRTEQTVVKNIECTSCL